MEGVPETGKWMENNSMKSGPVPTPGGSFGTKTPVWATTLMSRNDSGLDEGVLSYQVWPLDGRDCC